jgi:hypothetical protein
MSGPGDQHASNSNENPASLPDTAASKPPPRRRRRWGRRIGVAAVVVLLLLIILVVAAPSLVSTQAGTRYVLSLVNQRIAGTLQLRALSLSWSGPTLLQGVRVLDPERREVLNVDRVRAAPGVWRLITGALNFGEIVVGAPRAVLYLNADNRTSIGDAFQLRSPQPAPPASRAAQLPQPRGRVVLDGGSVRVVRAEGPAYELADVEGELELQTLSTLSGKVHAAFPDGARLTAEADVHDLVAQGALQPMRAAGTLSVKTDGAVELGPLTRVLTPAQAVDGRFAADVQAAGTANDLKGRFVLDVTGLQTPERQTAHAAPVDLQVKGQASRKGDTLAAQAEFSAGDAGRASARLTYRLGGATASGDARVSSASVDGVSPSADPPSADQVLSAILTGTGLNLPEFSLDVDGQLDLAKLGQAVPNLLKIRAGQEIAAGTVAISQVSLHGGAAPSVRGGLELKDLTITNGQRTTRLEPVSVAFDAALRSGSGLQVNQAELKSSFADVQAKGSASDLQATCRSNLGRLHAELGEVFDLSGFDLAGELASNVQLRRASDERVSVALDATVNGLQVTRPDQQLGLARLTLRQAGFFTLANRAVTRFDVSSAEANLDDQVLLSATGWYDVQKQGFKADANVTRADLGFLASRADNLGVSELGRYGGTVALQTTAERAAGNQPITATGSLTAQNLTVDNKPLVEGEAKLAWNNVQITPQTPRVQAEAIHLESTPANLDVRDVQWQGGEALVLNADLKGSADLARLMELIGAAAKMEKPPAIAGKLSLDSRVATADQVVSLTARGAVDDLAVGTGEQTVRQQRVDFDADGKLQQPSDRFTLSRAKLASAPFSAEIAGTVDRFSTERVLALKGRYDASWPQLMDLVHELVPATAKTVVVAGQSKSAFEITGPLQPQAGASPLRDLKSRLDIDWASAELYGLGLGAAKLSPALADGKLTLPHTTIPSGDGKVNLAAVVDLTQPDPMLNVAGKLQAFDRVPLSPQIAHEILGWISPIFMNVARIEGRVNLQTIDVHLPLSEAIKKTGDARGVLDLQDVKLEPGGLLGELTKLAGRTGTEPTAVTFNKVNFEVKDGRVHYDDLTLTFPNSFDLKFYGSVGFDSTLALVVSLPVRGPMLDRLGLKGPVGGLTQELSGLRVDVPLVGTREHPQLDFAKVDKAKLLKQLVVPAAPGKEVEGLLKKLPGLSGGKGGK